MNVGGATQNSIRTAQWVLGGPAGSTAYFGCVGKDEAAATLKKRAADDGVDARLVFKTWGGFHKPIYALLQAFTLYAELLRL